MAAKQPMRPRVVGREWDLPIPRGARTVACMLERAIRGHFA